MTAHVPVIESRAVGPVGWWLAGAAHRHEGGTTVESVRRAPAVFTTSALLALGAVSAACGSDDDASTTADTGAETPAENGTEATAQTDDDADAATPDVDAELQRFPDVIGATATFDGQTWTIAATLSSPYDTPERYADSWRVLGLDGTVYGERFLTHDHANEQPFTRSQSGIVIPDGVDVVIIEGRDQQYGWGGDTFELLLDAQPDG